MFNNQSRASILCNAEMQTRLMHHQKIPNHDPNHNAFNTISNAIAKSS